MYIWKVYQLMTDISMRLLEMNVLPCGYIQRNLTVSPFPLPLCSQVPQEMYSCSSVTYFEIPTASGRNLIWEGSILSLNTYTLYIVRWRFPFSAQGERRIQRTIPRLILVGLHRCLRDVMLQQVHHYACEARAIGGWWWRGRTPGVGSNFILGASWSEPR